MAYSCKLTASARRADAAVQRLVARDDHVGRKQPPRPLPGGLAELRAARRVFTVGVGRVSLALQAFTKRLAHLGIDAWVVGSINEPALEPGDLLVVGSGSGESLVPVAIARRARELGGRILYMGSNASSTVAGLADRILRIPCRTKLALPDEIASEQPMASLFEQALLLVCDAMCLMIARRAGLDARSYRGHANLE